MPYRRPNARPNEGKAQDQGQGIQAWVTQAQAERIRALLGDVTYHAPAPSRRKPRTLDYSRTLICADRISANELGD